MQIPYRPALMALLLASCPTAGMAADITPRCPSPTSSALLTIMRSAPDAVVFEYRGRQAWVGIRLFNSLPPQENQTGDRFYIAMRPGFPFSRVMVAQHGCIEDAVLVDVRVATAIRKAIKRFVGESSI